MPVITILTVSQAFLSNSTRCDLTNQTLGWHFCHLNRGVREFENCLLRMGSITKCVNEPLSQVCFALFLFFMNKPNVLTNPCLRLNPH